jgi:DNA-binding transcriptional regulator YdaS (Cro superfamily)
MTRASVSPYRTILAHAAALSGGNPALAAMLKVDTSDVQAWVSGLREIPEEVFHRALDIVLAEPASYTRKQLRKA